MASMKVSMIVLLVCATYFVKECQAEARKPEIAYLGRFLFKLGTSFIPQPPCNNEPVAGEGFDDGFEEDPLAEQTEAAETTEATTTELSTDETTETTEGITDETTEGETTEAIDTTLAP